MARRPPPLVGGAQHVVMPQTPSTSATTPPTVPDPRDGAAGRDRWCRRPTLTVRAQRDNGERDDQITRRPAGERGRSRGQRESGGQHAEDQRDDREPVRFDAIRPRGAWSKATRGAWHLSLPWIRLDLTGYRGFVWTLRRVTVKVRFTDRRQSGERGVARSSHFGLASGRRTPLAPRPSTVKG